MAELNSDKLEMATSESAELVSNDELESVSGGACSEDSEDKCCAKHLQGWATRVNTCSHPNHQSVGKEFKANGGGLYRHRTCLGCGAVWTEWLSNKGEGWLVWNFGEYSSRW